MVCSPLSFQNFKTGFESGLAVPAAAVRRQVRVRPGLCLRGLLDGVVGVAALLRRPPLRLPRQLQDSARGPILFIRKKTLLRKLQFRRDLSS